MGTLGAGGEVTSVHATHGFLHKGTVVAEVFLSHDTPCMLSLEGRE